MSSSISEIPYVPAWWLPEGHSQTLWRRLRPSPVIQQNRQRLELDDGDFLDLDWYGQSKLNDKSKPIMLILHGLCGCSGSTYVQTLQATLESAGYCSVCLNFRGCSGEPNRSAKAYHSGIIEDLESVFKQLSQLHPQHQLSMTGFSLGANVLLKWLGEYGGRDNLAKAVAVSTPFDLARCSNALQRGFSQFYGKYFLLKLVKDLRRKKQHFIESGNLEQLAILEALGPLTGMKTLREFDDKVTAPLHGFGGAQDYYQQCSSLSVIPRIQTHTLLVQSLNDPLIPPKSLPLSAQLPDCVQIQQCDNGGHVGFVSSSQKYWLEHRIVRFLDS